MNFGLEANISTKITAIFSKYDKIDIAIIYGSRAKGNHHKGSDIDITLKGEDLNLVILNKILDDIDNLLLPYKFDLSIFDNIKNPSLLEHINRVGKIFYRK